LTDFITSVAARRCLPPEWNE